MRRTLRSIIPSVLLLCSISCSDDADDPAAPAPEAPTTQTRTIPPTGGSLTVQNAFGTQCTLTLPSGAVLAPTQLTLQSTATPLGMLARFVIKPAGVNLLEPATITIRLADGTPIDESVGVAFASGERVPIPTGVDLGTRTLRATTYHLGFDLPVPVNALAAEESFAAESQEFIDVQDFECQLIRDSLTDAILRAQAFSGPFPPSIATPLIQQYRAALEVCETLDSLGEAGTAMAQLACINAGSAETQSQVLLVESVADFKQSLGALLAAEGLVQLTGSDCHVQSATFESEFNEYIDSYLARIEDPGFTASFANWDALWRELVPCTELLAAAREFEVGSAQTRIEQELMPALFARLREVAAYACEEDENNGLLADILTGGHLLRHPIAPTPDMPSYTGFSQAELLDQFHRCGSLISFEARSPQGDVIDTAFIEGGTSTTITVIKDGRITIQDELLGLMCGDVLARDEVSVLAEIPGTFVTTPLGILNGDRTIDVAGVLNALPGDEPVNFDLVFTRARVQCGIDDGGTTPMELYRTSVTVLGGAGAGGGTWQGNCEEGPLAGTFQVTIDNDGNVTGTYEGAVSGGITGTVDGSGTLNASASGAAGTCTWSGTVSGFAGNLTGQGTWGGCGSCSGSWSFGFPN
jgi:hypothetical protein